MRLQLGLGAARDLADARELSFAAYAPERARLVARLTPDLVAESAGGAT